MNDSDTVDVSEMPEVIRLIEAASKSGKSIELKRGSDVVATLSTTPSEPGAFARRAMTEAQIASLRSAAGSWKEFDSEAFLKHIYEERDRDDRPLADL
jgi:hypothetical protein